MEKTPRIQLLIAEDEQVLRSGLASLPWEKNGITLLPPAKNGLEAVECAKAQRVDILLTDIRMPGLSGLDAAKQIRELYPNMEVLFLSGYGEFEYAQKAIRLQACNYILKPSTPDAILSAVREAGARVQMQRSERGAVQQLRQQVETLSKVVVTSRTVEEQRAQEIPCEEDIVKIVGYIGSNYREQITLTSLAEAFHFNSVYLSRFIKKKSGHTFTELLTSTRMYHAARLLKETSLKNGEICERIGMGDERYFGQVFQKAYGMTPHEYRKSSKKPEQDLMKALMGEHRG